MIFQNAEIPTTILQQLGGHGRLNAFLGIKSYTHTEDSLSFRFKARGLKGINAVKVQLDPMDTYNVTFQRVSKNGAKIVAETTDVYCDELVDLVERTTGLYLHF